MFNVYSLEVWDNKIEDLKEEIDIWKEREPENIDTFTMTEPVYIPESAERNGGRRLACAIFKGDDILYRRICVIVGIKIK